MPSATPATSPVTRLEQLDRTAVLLLIACCMFWGLQQVLAKATLTEVAPMAQASFRVLGATALLMVWCRIKGIRLFDADGSLGPGLLAGTLFAAEFACIFLGLQYTSASRLTIFLYTSPFWVAACLPLFVHTERLRLQQWLGLACAFAAVVFVLSHGQTHGALAWGDMLGLAAGAFWGLTTVSIRATGLIRIAPEKLLFYQLASSAVLLPAMSGLRHEAWFWNLSAFAWASLLAQTAIGAFASYLVWMWMLGRYPATRISAFVFLTPLFALLFGALWLGEPVSSQLLAGLALVAAGIVLVNRKRV